MTNRSKQVIGTLGIFAMAYVIFSLISQAPAERYPAIFLSLIVIVISLSVIAYTMIMGRRARRHRDAKPKK